MANSASLYLPQKHPWKPAERTQEVFAEMMESLVVHLAHRPLIVCSQAHRGESGCGASSGQGPRSLGVTAAAPWLL